MVTVRLQAKLKQGSGEEMPLGLALISWTWKMGFSLSIAYPIQVNTEQFHAGSTPAYLIKSK